MKKIKVNHIEQFHAGMQIPVHLSKATPILRFSPTAWAKFHFFRNHGDTEIGGFGISSAKDLLFVEDFQTVRQTVSWASVSFDDISVADFFENQVDLGRKPEQFARIWLHSHPGNCCLPSGTDEETFQRVFGQCQWAIMCIVAKGGKTYARLRFNVGPGGEIEIPVDIDFSNLFPASNHRDWEEEYQANIHPEVSAISEAHLKFLMGEDRNPGIYPEDDRDFPPEDHPWWM